ncbi:MAG: hypothetical protein P8106_08355 [Gammaproteobacteria bacterium]|jgi:hypothetical protein
MKVKKRTSEYTIYARNDGRYAVKGKDGPMLHGEDKVKVLQAEGLVKLSQSNPAPASAEAAPAESEGG